MERFKSQRHLQRFVSINDPIANLFHIPRYDISLLQTSSRTAFRGNELVGKDHSGVNRHGASGLRLPHAR